VRKSQVVKARHFMRRSRAAVAAREAEAEEAEAAPRAEPRPLALPMAKATAAEPTVEEPTTPKAKRAKSQPALERPLNVPPKARRLAITGESTALVDPYNPPPNVRVAPAKAGETVTVEFDRAKLSPEVTEMLQHLRPSRTTKGASSELTLLRTLTKPAMASEYLEVYEKFPNRMITALSRQQHVSDRVRELVKGVRDGAITKDLERVPPPALALEDAPEPASGSRGRSPRRRTPEPVRMDSPGDDLLERVDRDKLPEPLRNDVGDLAVALVSSKRAYNAAVEAEDSKARARSLSEEQARRVESLQERAQRLVKGTAREQSDQAYAWFKEMADKYLQDLQKRAGQPIKMHKKERDVLPAIRDRSRSPPADRSASAKRGKIRVTLESEPASSAAAPYKGPFKPVKPTVQAIADK
jgi:hypothetical protein